NALLQTISTTTGGTYSIVVGGAGSTTGSYTVQVALNAALEAEGLLPGATNATLATAQDVSTSFISLQGLSPLPQRAAVAGQIAATVSPGTNILTNGGFETGTLAGWTGSATGSPGWEVE